MGKRGIRLLIVEDQDALVENLYEFLEPRGFVLDRAPDGVTGLHLAVVNDYDVIVLDLMLPGMSGIDVCERLRKDAGKSTAILMLTARDTLKDKLDGFRIGADDYLVKPFDLEELEARIFALAARGGRRQHELQVGELRFDTGTLEIRRNGRRVVLNRAGEKLLEALMRAYPNVVPRSEMEYALWADDPPDSDTLRSHVYALRRAIDQEGEYPMLHTVHRLGYRLIDEAAEQL